LRMARLSDRLDVILRYFRMKRTCGTAQDQGHVTRVLG
jgi:hypothetical protein